MFCQYASFVLRCLLSDNSIVTATSQNEVFAMRMLSPVGSNAQLCCDYFGLPLSRSQQKAGLVRFYSNSELDCIFIINEVFAMYFCTILY